MNPYTSQGRVQGVGSWAGFFSGIGKFVAPILPKVAEVGFGIGSAWALDRLIGRPAPTIPGTIPSAMAPAANQANQESHTLKTMTIVGAGVAAVAVIFLVTRSRR